MWETNRLPSHLNSPKNPESEEASRFPRSLGSQPKFPTQPHVPIQVDYRFGVRVNVPLATAQDTPMSRPHVASLRLDESSDFTCFDEFGDLLPNAIGHALSSDLQNPLGSV